MSGYVSFAGVYDRLTLEIDYPARGRYFDECIRRHGGKKGVLLDMGCGTGSMCEVMAGLGYDVMGADDSYEMLTEAMNKRMQSGADIVYVAQSMTELDLPGKVDVIISTLDSLNHLTEYADFDRAIERAALFLEKDGVFVFDVNSVYKHERILAGNTFVYDLDDIYCVWQNTPGEGYLTEMDLDIFVQDEDGAYTRMEDHFAERGYTHEQITASLQKHGLKLCAVYHADSFDPPREDSQRLIYVAKHA
ncbi:MAG TPA: class I SAM-dependent methyltransferase [Candidatus Faecivivens stercoripullorum]|uniref:Class I SAM-dependent methyltransferase n=1 Tax=Candidatus Faecivivens stercoripullorum TaxID=2840805 RepID=A0A9D1KS53_9FIRM|nr:class I SAM-dependent methyltransferase [Candidatus Faecivivens stercoripullorum]